MRLRSEMSAQEPNDLLRLAFVVVRDCKGVLDPDIVPGRCRNRYPSVPPPCRNQLVELGEHPLRIVGMEMLDPELRIVPHLPRCISHDRIQILADERAGKVTRNLGRVDNRRDWRRQAFAGPS